MSHLLWKYYWENDVEKFRRVLAPASFHTSTPSKSPGIGVGSFVSSTAAHGTSPKATKSRKSSGYGAGSGGAKGGSGALSRSEVNSRDSAGLTVLLRAVSSSSELAIHYVHALLEHPALDLYVQDPESGWNALHRALYAGNISIARLLLEKERRDTTGDGVGSSTTRVGQLIKTKDHEGNSPFDLYNSTIAIRSLEHKDDSASSDGASDSDSVSGDGLGHTFPSGKSHALFEGEELYMFGSNKNVSLGVGDGDDRQYPERIQLKRPKDLIARFYLEYLKQNDREDTARSLDSIKLDEIPTLIRNRPLVVCDVVLSKFHSAVLTTDPVSNLYVCGVGRGGRLGLGDENTQFRFAPVQGGLADKKVIQVALGQNHTLAVTERGELWTWGSNSNSQLGYAVPQPLKRDEEPGSAIPRQVFGPLKKESILGVAASAIHSVVHTGSSLYCWGKNVGQLALMDSDSRSLEIQPTPRKVAASLFSAPIAMVSAIDKATTCLLANHSVCIFTAYGYNFVQFPHPDVFANQSLSASVSTRYDPGSRHVSYVTSGAETIAALTSRGDVFTVSLNHKADASTTMSTTNPSKIKGAITQPQCIWNARKEGVKSVSVSEHGSVIISTESGSVWRRVKRITAKDTSQSSAEFKRKDFKFQRVPSITNAVAVRGSTFGTFAAIRKDCDVMKAQLMVEAQSLWKDLALLQPLRGFESSSKRVLSSPLGEVEMKSRLGVLPYELLRSPDVEDDLAQYLRVTSFQHSELDLEVCTTSAPNIRIPVHSWILAARSTVIRTALACCRVGKYEATDFFTIEPFGTKSLLTFRGLDIITVLNLVVYAYEDRVLPAWNFTRHAPELAPRYRAARAEVMKMATKLDMMQLEAAARLQTVAMKTMDKDLRSAVRQRAFLETGDVILELDGAQVPVHSHLICQRCPFFDGFFNGRSQGQWLASRLSSPEKSEKVRIDLKHVDPAAFRFVLEYLYADTGVEIFNDVLADNLDDLSELVLEVLSVANELMLDRLSQICQHFLGQFVTTRNVAPLLNEISPCTMSDFKDAGLEYICLQTETMLENHLLDGLDDDLLQELDEVVRGNQLARSPIARSDGPLLLLLEKYPELVADIDEERQRRVKEIAFKARQGDDDKKLAASFKTRIGSFEDGIGASPVTDRTRRRSKVGGNEPFSPNLRPKDSRVDLIFPMDDEDTPSLSNPILSIQAAANQKPGDAESQVTVLSNAWREAKAATSGEVGWVMGSASSPTRPTESLQTPTSPSSLAVIDTTSQKLGSPWRPAPAPVNALGLREIMSEASATSMLTASLAAHRNRDERLPPVQKMSQRDRKKQQIQAATQAARAAQEAQIKQDAQRAWERPPADPKPAPWKPIAAAPRVSLKEDLAVGGSVPKNSLPALGSQPTTLPPPLKTIPRRTASPDTRFAGQFKLNGQAAGPTASSPHNTQQGLVPHSRSYMAPRPRPEPVLGQSMVDIIKQEKREQQIVKEAVAKRSLQEIQQEQEFQEWWDQESKRMQEEEAKKLARDREKDEREKEKEGRTSRGRGGRRSRGGRVAGDIARPSERLSDGASQTTIKGENNAHKRAYRGRGERGRS